MANPEHLEILKQGVAVWNRWREEGGVMQPDLSGASLENTNLQGANLSEVILKQANLKRAELQWTNFYGADLSGTETNLNDARLMNTNLSYADLSGADLSGVYINDARAWYTKFCGANLCRAYLWGTDFREADFTEANLTGANLQNTNLVMVNFREAILVDCKVFGISAWNIDLEGATQENLIINHPQESLSSPISVDNLQVAQFIYLLLNNKEIRNVIDTITSKVVLILGNFAPARKAVLDAIRDELRKHNYLPVLFDFEKPISRDLTETISTLAHMARFIIADITDAKSIPQELQRIVPDLPSVPVQPLLSSADREYAMFEHFRRYPWVLPEVEYDQVDDLLDGLGDKVIAPAEAKVKELAG